MTPEILNLRSVLFAGQIMIAFESAGVRYHFFLRPDEPDKILGGFNRHRHGVIYKRHEDAERPLRLDADSGPNRSLIEAVKRQRSFAELVRDALAAGTKDEHQRRVEQANAYALEQLKEAGPGLATELERIAASIGDFDRACQAGEGTDLDAAWELLHSIKRLAEAAVKRARAPGESAIAKAAAYNGEG